MTFLSDRPQKGFFQKKAFFLGIFYLKFKFFLKKSIKKQRKVLK